MEHDKITLTSTGKKLDYHDNVVNIDIDNPRPQDVIWFYNDRFYTLTECCRGTYQSGQKEGQLCWKTTAYGEDGLCSKHKKQHNLFNDNEN